MVATTEILKLLYIEDSPDDVELVSRALQRSGVQHIIDSVDSKSGLEEKLSSHSWDAVLSDFNLPGFSGSQALLICKQKLPTVPFIIVSGAIGEELAVDLLREGASDFVSKSNLSRLGPALLREIENRRLIKSKENELLAYIEAIPHMAFISNSIGDPLFVNQKYRDFFGIGHEDLEQWDWRNIEIIHPEDVAGAVEAIARAFTNRSSYRIEYRLRKYTGEYRWHNASASPIIDFSTGEWRFYGTITDIHEQKLAEDSARRYAVEMEKLKEQAETANRLKSIFLANMSHEIRTPLGAMLGFADLLKDPQLTAEEKQSFIEILQKNGQQLAEIINDILDLSKVEADQLSLESIPTSPATIVKDVINLFSLKAKDKGLSLEFEFDPSTPELVLSDPVRIRQILLNLVGNSIKFTSEGRIVIRSYSFLDESFNHFVAMEVTDTGIGMSPQAKEKVFDMFVQADGSMTRKFGGTGLGLTLSRKLARQMGGDIQITRTALEKGSTFLFTFKYQPQSATPSVVEKQPVQEVSTEKLAEHSVRLLEGVRVLVVDDSIDNRHLFWLFLSRAGAVIETAEDGLQAYDLTLTGKFDLVLMDIQMPRMDGYTATQKLRQSGYTKPIIALSAHAMHDVHQQCLDAGYNGYISKPVDPVELIRIVKNHL